MLLTLDQAAAALGMKRERLLRMARRMEIGHVRDGRFYRFAQKHLEEWQQAHEVHPVTDYRRSRPKKRAS